MQNKYNNYQNEEYQDAKKSVSSLYLFAIGLVIVFVYLFLPPSIDFKNILIEKSWWHNTYIIATIIIIISAIIPLLLKIIFKPKSVVIKLWLSTLFLFSTLFLLFLTYDAILVVKDLHKRANGEVGNFNYEVVSILEMYKDIYPEVEKYFPKSNFQTGNTYLQKEQLEQNKIILKNFLDN